MKEYHVRVTRVVTFEAHYYVDAATENEAIELAREKDCNEANIDDGACMEVIRSPKILGCLWST